MDMVGLAYSIRRKSKVLGIRRQTYYAREHGNRPEQKDAQIAEQLHAIKKQYVAWGFWMTFHYLRNQGHLWNAPRRIIKCVYRIWKYEALHLRKPTKRAKLKRLFQDFLAQEKVNKGWAMAPMARTLAVSG